MFTFISKIRKFKKSSLFVDIFGIDLKVERNSLNVLYERLKIKFLRNLILTRKITIHFVVIQ